MRSKNWWVYLSVVVLLVVGILVMYKYKLVEEVQNDREYAQGVYEMKGSETIDRQDPVAKNLVKSSVDGKVRGYFEIRGVLLEDVTLGSDNLLRGSFYVDGDESERRINLLAGSREGKVYFGEVKYDDTGRYGGGTWKYRDNSEVEGVLTEGMRVYVVLEYDIEDQVETYRKDVEVLTSLLADIESGDGEYELPVGFSVSVPKLGLVIN